MPARDELTVLIRAQDEASAALRQVGQSLRVVAEGSAGASTGFGRLRDAAAAVGSMLGDIARQAVSVAAGFALYQGLGAAFSTVREGIVGMNAALETATLQFQTLLGDAGKAREHVQGLFRFAAETPFETGPIIEASRLLLTFGGAALATEENLRLVGDAAAATSQGINDVAFWVGRAYSMIQAGKPFGEAAMRLQEMGVLSASARARLEDLQASGASAAEVWAAMREELSRFNGAMRLQAGTWAGLTSTIKDNLSLLSATAFRPLFDLLKELAAHLSALVQSGEAQRWAERFAASLARLIDVGRDLVEGWVPKLREALAGLGGPSAQGLLALLNPLGALAREALPAAIPLLVELGRILAEIARAVGPQVAQLLSVLGTTVRDLLAQAMTTLAPLLRQVGELLAQIGTQLGPPLVALLAAVVPIIGQLLAALMPLISQGLLVLAEMVLPPLVSLLGQLADWLARNQYAAMALAAAAVAVAAAMAPIPALVVGLIALLGLLRQYWDEIVHLFANVVPAAAARVMESLLQIPVVGELLIGHLQILQAATEHAWDVIQIVVRTAMDVIRGVIQAATALIRGDWEGVWQGIATIFGAIWAGIVALLRSQLELVVSVVRAAWDTLVALTGDLPGRIVGALAGLGSLLWDLAKGAFAQLAAGAEAAWWGVLGWLAAVPGRIRAALGDLSQLLWGVGRDIVYGLWGGMQSLWDWLLDRVRGFAGAIKGAVQGALGIFSPSRVMAELGEQTALGMAVGLERGWRRVTRSLLAGVRELPVVAAGGVGPSAPVTQEVTVQILGPVQVGSAEEASRAGRDIAYGIVAAMRARGMA